MADKSKNTVNPGKRCFSCPKPLCTSPCNDSPVSKAEIKMLSAVRRSARSSGNYPRRKPK